jgi:hypothetical protein
MQDQDSRKRHFYISLVKSVLRIFAGATLLYGVDYLMYAGLLLISAEVLGILEEL